MSYRAIRMYGTGRRALFHLEKAPRRLFTHTRKPKPPRGKHYTRERFRNVPQINWAGVRDTAKGMRRARA